MEVTLFKKPNGARQVVEVTNVRAEDAAWFAQHGAKLSMEETGGTFAIYADVGVKDKDGEPVEALELASGRSCEDTFRSLRMQAEGIFGSSR